MRLRSMSNIDTFYQCWFHLYHKFVVREIIQVILANQLMPKIIWKQTTPIKKHDDHQPGSILERVWQAFGGWANGSKSNNQSSKAFKDSTIQLPDYNLRFAIFSHDLACWVMLLCVDYDSGRGYFDFLCGRHTRWSYTHQ